MNFKSLPSAFAFILFNFPYYEGGPDHLGDGEGGGGKSSKE